MKKRRLLAVIAISVIMGFILSSCGIIKNKDFSSRKYTHFRKGETVVVINPVKTEKEIASNKALTIEKKSITDNNKFVNKNTITSSQPIDKSEKSVVKKENKIALFSKVKKEKVQRTANFIMNRIVNKANTTSVSGGDVNILVLVILSIVLPPLAVYLARGIGTEFWISIILTILFWFPGIIYAFLVIFDVV